VQFIFKQKGIRGYTIIMAKGVVRHNAQQSYYIYNSKCPWVALLLLHI